MTCVSNYGRTIGKQGGRTRAEQRVCAVCSALPFNDGRVLKQSHRVRKQCLDLGTPQGRTFPHARDQVTRTRRDEPARNEVVQTPRVDSAHVVRARRATSGGDGGVVTMVHAAARFSEPRGSSSYESTSSCSPITSRSHRFA